MLHRHGDNIPLNLSSSFLKGTLRLSKSLLQLNIYIYMYVYYDSVYNYTVENIHTLNINFEQACVFTEVCMTEDFRAIESYKRLQGFCVSGPNKGKKKHWATYASKCHH